MNTQEQQNQPNDTKRLYEPAAANRAVLKAWDHPESNWNQAAMATPQIDPFCCRTEWQLSYNEAMSPNRELFVREVPGSVVALAKLRVPDGVRLFGPMESHWFFGCPLLGPDAVELLDDLLGEFTLQADRPPPIFMISGMAPRSELIKKLIKQMGSRFVFQLHQPETLCSASLEGGLDSFLSRRSAKHRSGLRTQSRRAAKQGVTFERHAPKDPAHAAQIYERILAVEASSWKGIGECGMAVEPSRAYYACMLRRLSVSGGSRVMFARHGERDIGYIFGGLAGNVYRGQQFSYAEDWKSFSIGNLLQLELISWLCEQGIVRYDMGPLMEYKNHWAENRYPISTLVLRHKHPKSGSQYELPF